MVDKKQCVRCLRWLPRYNFGPKFTESCRVCFSCQNKKQRVLALASETAECTSKF